MDCRELDFRGLVELVEGFTELAESLREDYNLVLTPPPSDALAGTLLGVLIGEHPVGVLRETGGRYVVSWTVSGVVSLEGDAEAE